MGAGVSGDGSCDIQCAVLACPDRHLRPELLSDSVVPDLGTENAVFICKQGDAGIDEAAALYLTGVPSPCCGELPGNRSGVLAELHGADDLCHGDVYRRYCRST